MIPQFEPTFSELELEYMTSYLKRKPFLTEFIETRNFETKLSSFMGAKHVIAVNNGTISLSIALLACGVKKGDRVAVPNFTMIATYNAIKFIGAEPVLIDVEEESLCLNYDDLLKVAKLNAVIFTNSNGRSGRDLKKVREYCTKHEIPLIEDSAQALGSYSPNGTHCGLTGDVGSLSFSVPKIITTGQGGALITNDEKISQEIKYLKDFGREAGGNDIHNKFGINSKFTDLQAIIGLAQFEDLEQRIQHKRSLFERYKANLSKVDGIKLVENDTRYVTPWFYEILCDNPQKIKDALTKFEIGFRPMYPPINSQKSVNVEGKFPVSTYVGKQGLWLPSSSNLTMQQIDFICDVISQKQL